MDILVGNESSDQEESGGGEISFERIFENKLSNSQAQIENRVPHSRNVYPWRS